MSRAGAPASSFNTTSPIRSIRRRVGSVRLGGIVGRAAAPEQAGTGPERRPADGGDQPRWQARLLHELALHAMGRPVLSGRRQRLDGQGRCAARGRDGAGREVLPASPTGCARTRSVWKAETPHRTRTATRDSRGEDFMDWQRDGVSRRLPRHQPRYGMAVRGRAGHAGRHGARSVARVASDRARARGGRQRRRCDRRIWRASYYRWTR